MAQGKGHARPSGEVQGVVSFLHALGSPSPDALPGWLAADGLDASGVNWLKAQGLAAAGDPVWARYNAPFTPWFLRRNEILVPLANQ